MSYSDLILLDRPVAYWPLQEGAGTATAALDLTGHGHDLVTHYFGGYSSPGSPHYTFGAAGPFAGQTALASVHGILYGSLVASNPTGLPQQIGSYSWEAWLYYDEAADTHGGGANFMVQSPSDWATDTNGVNGFLNLWDGYAGGSADHYSIDWTMNGSSSLAHTDAGSISTNAWHHVVCTAQDVGSSGGAAAVYIDGVLMHLAFTHPAAPADWGPTQRFWLLRQYAESSTPNASIAHAALYDRALTPCEVLSHYDLATTGSYTGCQEWVRLIHATGRSDWRTNGERIEERAADKLSRRHDGHTSTVFSDEVPVLQTPLGVLLSSPPQLVGKDPATNLPAYCPPPPVVAIAPTPPATPPTTVDPNEFRCNIAHYVAGEMELAYGYAVAKINTMNSAQWTLIGLGGPLAGIILALLNVAFPPLMIVTGFGVGLMALLGNDAQTAALLPLGGPAVEAVAQALYCALVPDSAGQFQITGTTLFNWSYNLTTFGADFTGNQLAEVRLLITVYQPAYWAQLAIQAGASGSTLCGGYSCSGLLP